MEGTGGDIICLCAVGKMRLFYLLSQGLHTFRLLDLVFIPFRLNF